MHVTLTDFRDLARSVMDTGTETILSAGGQGTLDLEADHEGSAVLAPLSVHIVERSKSLHIFLGIVPLMINGEPKKKNLVGNSCKFNSRFI